MAPEWILTRLVYTQSMAARLESFRGPLQMRGRRDNGQLDSQIDLRNV